MAQTRTVCCFLQRRTTPGAQASVTLSTVMLSTSTAADLNGGDSWRGEEAVHRHASALFSRERKTKAAVHNTHETFKVTAVCNKFTCEKRSLALPTEQEPPNVKRQRVSDSASRGRLA